MAGNTNKSYIERTRRKIQAGQYVERLGLFVMGEIEMTGDQVRAAIALIDRVIPRLAQQNVTVEDKREKQPREMTLAELQTEWMSRLPQTPESLN